jgi:hypothetical protein
MKEEYAYNQSWRVGNTVILWLLGGFFSIRPSVKPVHRKVSTYSMAEL